MRPPLWRRSLRARILLAVIGCAVLPLAAVGGWLTATAVRSGELLLRSQLDSTVAHAVAVAGSVRRHRESDLRFLAENAPMRAALRATIAPESIPRFVQRAFETMSHLQGAVVRDARGQTRWTLGDAGPPAGPLNGASTNGAGRGGPLIELRAAIRDDSAGTILGEVVGWTRLDALASSPGGPETAVSTFLALRDRRSDRWVAPGAMPEHLLDQEHFTWGGHRWLGVRGTVPEIGVDIVAAAWLDPFVAPFAHTARVGAVALALAAAGVLALTILVTGRLTRSLGRLAGVADRAGMGDLDARVAMVSDDEVGRVARTFNGMMDNLGRLMRELSQREAVAAMGELAATLAHQLRSPATAVRLDVHRAHDKLPHEAPERALLARALEQLDRLERAIAGALKVARSADAVFGTLDVGEPLHRAIDGVRQDFSGRGVRIDDSRLPSAGLQVRGDAASLEQLFANLLANAAQASGENGRVTISADGTDGCLTIAIQDEGPGMTPEVLARSGEPLFSTRPEGTGLGLAIARRIAVAHQGSLTITSAPGAGTTVRLELPRLTT